MIANNGNIKIEISGTIKGCAKYGLLKLEESLSKTSHAFQNEELIVGSYLQSDYIKKMTDEGVINLPIEDEAFVLKKLDDKQYILAGYDYRGLMYACLEIVERLTFIRSLRELDDINEKPATKVRGIFTFLHNKELENEWFYSKDYWDKYFDMLAFNRYNSFNLVFSHQTHYLAPMFAYFLHMDEFPDVCPIDATYEDISRNYYMLCYIADAAASRGVDFILGIWQVRAWTGGDGDWRPSQKQKIIGLTDNNITEYTYAALKMLLKNIEGIKGLQIRINEESGIKKEMQTQFYTDTFFKAINECERYVLLDLRGWRYEQDTIDNAIEMCPNLRLSSKYWAEFLGAPYQPAKIDPGYSYSNLLNNEKKYNFMWQVWGLGNPRLLLWGDYEYVKRFTNSLTLGDGIGFEVNPPLCQKGYGDDAGSWSIFKDKKYEYFEYEYERYWMFYRLFGRVTYSPESLDYVCKYEMDKRYGSIAQTVTDAYKYGSRVNNFLVQYMLSDPNMYVWPEIDTGGLLDYYLETPTSDKCTISTIAEYVSEYLLNDLSGRLTPDEASKYFAGLADKLFDCIYEIEMTDDLDNNKELYASVIDFKVYANIAMFHSYKIQSAKELNFYYETRNFNSLKRAKWFLDKASKYWEQIVSITQDFYYEDMVFAPLDNGHWKKKLILLYEDQLRLNELINIFESYGNFDLGFDFGAETKRERYEFGKFPVLEKYSVERGFIGVSQLSKYSKDNGFGFLNLEGIDASSMSRVRLSDKHTDNIRRDGEFELNYDKLKGLRNALYEDYACGRVSSIFCADVENGEYEVTIILTDQTANARSHGPMSIEVNGTKLSSIILKPVEVIEKKVLSKVTNGKIVIALDCDEGRDWLLAGLVIKSVNPVIKHVPIHYAGIGMNNIIEATVTSSQRYESVILHITTEHNKTHKVIMKKESNYTYSADINDMIADLGSRCVYHISTSSNNGNEIKTQSVKMLIRKEMSKISLVHDCVKAGESNSDIEIVCFVDSVNALSKIRLYYSYVNQFEETKFMDMERKGSIFSAIIPKEYLDERFDILYYFEVVDIFGEGQIYPDFFCERPYYVIKIN